MEQERSSGFRWAESFVPGFLLGLCAAMSIAPCLLLLFLAPFLASGDLTTDAALLFLPFLLILKYGLPIGWALSSPTATLSYCYQYRPLALAVAVSGLINFLGSRWLMVLQLMSIWSYAVEDFVRGASLSAGAFGVPLALARAYAFLSLKRSGRGYLGWWLFVIGLVLMVSSSGFFYIGLDVIDSPVASPGEQDQGAWLMLLSLLGFGCSVVLLVTSWVPRLVPYDQGS